MNRNRRSKAPRHEAWLFFGCGVVVCPSIAAYLSRFYVGRGQVQQFVSDGETRAAIAKGGRIEKVLVIAMRKAGGARRAEYVPYFASNWKRGYVAVGLWGGKGARSWRDLTRLVGFFRDELAYDGPITIHQSHDPQLGKLRTIFLQTPSAAADGDNTIEPPEASNTD